MPVKFSGKDATLVVDLGDEGDLSLSDAAFQREGIPLADTARAVTLTIGGVTESNVAVRHITKPGWKVNGPEKLPPIVGIAGVHFMARYDLLYDFPGRRVRLYEVPAGAREHPVAAGKAWLPPGIKPTDCGKMVPVPPGASTFTGVAMQLDGHPVTGVFEMGPYYPKMNSEAVAAMGLTSSSSRIQNIPNGVNPPGYSHNGYTIALQVPDVHNTIGTHTFWTGPVQIFPEIDVQSLLPSKTPVMLANLTMLRQAVLYNSVSSQQVCVGEPGAP